MPVTLETSIQEIKGVGPRRAEMLAGANIHTVEGLLKYKPLRYEDRTDLRPIGEIEPDQLVVIEGQVSTTGRYTTPMKRMRIFEMVVKDDSGSVKAKFFNQPYLSQVFQRGRKVILYGIPRVDDYTQGISMINPEYEILAGGSDQKVHSGRIVPIYRKIGRLTTRTLRQFIFQLLADLPDQLDEPLPTSVVRKYKFPDLKSALEEIHFPSPAAGVSKKAYLQELDLNQTMAQQRFIFEEFYLFQLGLQLIKKQRESRSKKRFIRMGKGVQARMRSILPFQPTSAQARVLKEIGDDLCSSRVMNRLLQGDVGSGKTIVALQAMVIAIENGYQTALMVPTEILAEQHYHTVCQLLSGTGYRIAFLTSSVKGKGRESVLGDIQSGKTDLIIGTHALIQKGVQFKKLGLVVIDEQHRFGVLQRSKLISKGDLPETLVMTATPIPRSLALTLYGDLDVSVLDEMPPGRQPVQTIVKGERNREEVYAFVHRELKEGRQAFVVYPLIEESEKMDLRAATEMAKHLQKEVFPDAAVVLMHGRLKVEEKGQLMRRFRAGEIQVLVSTTVIEVGIDIPGATVMVIEHAERFGLSQLHQLRGRIGRGQHPGLCILMTEDLRSQQADERINILCQTQDGFKIAEKDLEIRGPGEFLGTRQSGMPEFLFANIVRDLKLLELARQEAKRHLRHDLKSSALSPQEEFSRFDEWWRQRYGLYHVG
ncbi:MAG: ATP-dependent DNA helicase RecG [Acidobacteria bacterium]|nr:ATP-dependent DNA helicase RecG [Acidobacteriota bacterium]